MKWVSALSRQIDLEIGNFGKVNFEMVTGLSSWWFIVGLLISAGVGFSALERWEQKH